MRTLALCLILFSGMGLIVSAAPTEGDLFSEAESRYLGGNYTAALEAYDEFLAAYPLSDRVADVQYRRAVCLYRIGKHRDSIRLLGEVERKYRSTRYFAFVPLWKGLSLYAVGSYSLSVESLDAFISSQKDSPVAPQDLELMPQALLHKALALVALSSVREAEQTLGELTADHPLSKLAPYATVLLGSLLTQEKSFERLLELTEKTDMSSFPVEWRNELLLLRAEALWETGRPAEAAPLYEKLVGAGDEIALVAYLRLFGAAQGKEDLQRMRDLTQAAESRFAGRTGVLSDLWTRVGAESFRMGKLEAAELFLGRAWNVRKAEPVREVVPLYLAEILLSRGDREAARRMLEEFDASPDRSTGATIIRLGDIALMSEDFTAAAGHYTRFLEAFTDSPRAAEVEYLLAFCFFKLGRLNDSSRLVEGLLDRSLDPDTRREPLKLRIILLKKNGNMAEAAAALKEYIGRYPEDLGSRLDYLKTLFVLRDNAGVVREADGLQILVPALEKENPYALLVVQYLRGLALTAEKAYSRAIRDLESIREADAEKAGLGAVYPYARYYLGWSYVRTAVFDKAARVFDSFIQAYPTHELSSMAMYLAGWSHFSLGDFGSAAGIFQSLSERSEKVELAQKSLFLYAKSLLNMKRRQEAAAVLRSIAESTPRSPWADAALFDYAGALSDMGQARESADAFKSLGEGFPDSPLREQAWYRRAETLNAAGMWAEARSAFDEYRQKFPKGKLVDAALYWGGQAALSAAESAGTTGSGGFAAVLLWEQLIAGYRESPFRSSAIQKTAEVYARAREFSKALDLYTRFLAEYPEEARAVRADIRAEQLRGQTPGQIDKEAELSALVSRATGARRWEATIELAQLYVFGGERMETGYQLLLQALKDGDSSTAARAQFYMGEYFYRKGDLEEAARQFQDSAAKAGSDTRSADMQSADPEFAASAIYRASEMMKMAGRRDEVDALVKRLEEKYPDSEWTRKGRALREAAQ